MLTNRDIDLLLQAIKALEDAAGKDEFVETLLGAIMASSKQERDKFMGERVRQRNSAKLLAESGSEELILLKAKLIQLRPRGE